MKCFYKMIVIKLNQSFLDIYLQRLVNKQGLSLFSARGAHATRGGVIAVTNNSRKIALTSANQAEKAGIVQC